MNFNLAHRSSLICLAGLLLPLAAAEPEESASPWCDATGDLFAGEGAGTGIWRMTAWPGPGLLVASLVKRGLWASADGGTTWKRLGPAGQRPPDAGQAVQFLVDPQEPHRLWCSGMYGFGCWRSDDGGATFVQLGGNQHLDGLGVDLSDPQRRTLLEGLHEQARSLHLSTDGGATWTRIGDHLPDGTGFSTLPIVVDAKTYIVNTSGWGKLSWGIWRSTDAGATWAKTSDAGPADYALVATNGHIFWSQLWNGDHLVSRDVGVSWQPLNAPVRGLLCELPGGILVGLGGGKQSQPFASLDDGRTWKPFGDEPPFKPIGIIYDAKRNALICYRGESGPQAALVVRWDLPGSPATVIASGGVSRLTVWDGEGHAGGGGWIDAGADGFFRPQHLDVKSGTTALEFHVANALTGYGGWNWHNWALGQLTDITSCTHLKFWLKFIGDTPPATLLAELNCGPEKECSAAIDLLHLQPTLLNGEWQLVEVPLAGFTARSFDPHNTYELRLRTSTSTPHSYSLFIDTIRFVNHP